MNDADRRYLVTSLAALAEATQLSNVAAVGGADAEVRALARWTLAAQTRLVHRLSERLAVVDGAARRPARLAPGPAARRLLSLEGQALDRAYLELLTAHIDASLVRARTEMVDGLDHHVRAIAERVIRKHAHELDVIGRLSPGRDPASSPPDPPPPHHLAVTSPPHSPPHSPLGGPP